MHDLLETRFTAIRRQMRIAPITTMSYPSNDYGTFTHAQVVDQDLANIQRWLDEGWTVLGWQNNTTGTTSYAVGGGVAQRPDPSGVIPFPSALSAHVQASLAQFALDYP